MSKSFCPALMVSVVCALDLKAAVSAIEADTEATYGMVLPAAIASPIAAQTSVPTALAVGGGSEWQVDAPVLELLKKLKIKFRQENDWEKWEHFWYLYWQVNNSLELEGDRYFFGRVRNHTPYHQIIEFKHNSEPNYRKVQTDYMFLTPEMSKFRLLPGAVATVAAKLKGAFQFNDSTVRVSVGGIPSMLKTPEIPFIIPLRDQKEEMTGNGADYRGAQTKTRSGEDCQKWSAQTPHRHIQNIPASMPEADLAENFCRNPDNDVSIWCHTMNPDKMWDFCDPIISEHMGWGGMDYRGAQTKTRSGEECMKWSAMDPQRYNVNPARYPYSGLDENFCRNPYTDRKAIWCYTTYDQKWEYCNPLTE